ncbi:MAG: nitrogen fixation protein NifU [Verrucomicrobia bacterium]|nr:MAG: nitrogen fixation protein NifU [Verrucomicrobiota bacterium]
MSDLQQRIQEAVSHPKNLGEMVDADSVGTAGSAGCGDMLRMWVKFKEDATGRKVIDRATFQTFGCETAIAVASVATELVAGKTVAEALEMSSGDLAAPLGALPPMKIHCAQLVESALRSALAPAPAASAGQADGAVSELGAGIALGRLGPVAPAGVQSPSLRDSFKPPAEAGRKVQIVFKNPAAQ